MAKQKMVKLLSPEFRLSWPELFAPSSGMNENAEPKYRLVAIFRPADFTEQHKQLWKKMMAEIDRVSKERFRVPYAKLNLGSDHRPYRDGKDKTWNGAGEGTIIAKLSSKFKPGVVDRHRTPIVPTAASDGTLIMPDEIYPGVYARATTNVYAYDGHGNKGIKFGLLNVQITRPGERLDGRVDAADDFDDDLPEVEGDDIGDF